MSRDAIGTPILPRPMKPICFVMKVILDDNFSMPSFPGMAWMEGYRDRVNADPEMAVIGGWFTTALSLAFGEQRYVVGAERGQDAAINAAPRVDARAALRFRAPMTRWSK